MKKSWFIVLVSVGLLALASKTVSAEESLYNALGEKSGIHKIVGHMLDESFTDSRTKKQFEHTKKSRLHNLITDKICKLLGGPCQYKGLTMKKAHIKLGITVIEFDAGIEHLQSAMNKEKIPCSVQNELLVLLAPMKLDIVEEY